VERLNIAPFSKTVIAHLLGVHNAAHLMEGIPFRLQKYLDKAAYLFEGLDSLAGGSGNPGISARILNIVNPFFRAERSP